MSADMQMILTEAMFSLLHELYMQEVSSCMGVFVHKRPILVQHCRYESLKSAAGATGIPGSNAKVKGRGAKPKYIYGTAEEAIAKR